MSATSALPDFQKLFESAPGLYLVLDPALRIVAVSDAYARTALIRREEVLGKSVFEVFPDNPAAAGVHNFRTSFERVLGTRARDVMAVQRHDVRRREEDGGGFRERYWSPINSPVLADDGSVAWIIHHIEDVTESVAVNTAGVEQSLLNQTLRNARQATVNLLENSIAAQKETEDANTVLRDEAAERKRAEAKVQESEQRFRTMANSIPQLAWIARADGFIVWYNQRWYEYTGTTPEKMEGLGWQTVHDPQQLPKMMAQWTSAIAAGEGFEVEFPLRGADGQFRRFLTRAQPLKDAAGQVVQWFGTNTDVDELKRSEDALRSSESRVRTVLSALTEGVVFLNTAGVVEMANEAVEHVLGRKLVELSDSALDPHWQLIRGDGTPLPVEEHPAMVALRTGQAARGFELGVPQADGTVRWLSLNAELVHDASGVVLGVVVSFFNITAEKHAKEKIQQLNIELEQRVILRTSELELANKELETFSYSIAHDLRAPLRTMDGFAQMTLSSFSEQLPEKGLHYLQRICSGAQQMNALISDLLNFSKLSRQPVNKQAIITDLLVRLALDELGSPWPGRRVDLRVASLPACHGDKTLVKQVWINLLSNALKYTQKREQAVIEIGCQCDQAGQVFFVRDNGAGFDMRYAGKLFGVFERMHHVEDFEGSGIGLATVQRIVKRHGGRIWAEAAVDRGATFYFTLQEEIKS